MDKFSRKKYVIGQHKIFFMLILILIVLLVMGMMVHQNTVSQYRYDVAKSYRYKFSDPEENAQILPFKDEMFVIPETERTWDTGLLKVTINSTWLGYFLEPEITIITPVGRLEYTFEQGVHGDRYFTLPRGSCAPNHKIIMHSRHVLLPDQNIELTLFKNLDIKQQRVMIISPHPDDAEIAAYGIYSDVNKPFIITLTAGDAGSKKYDEIYQSDKEHYKKKGELRVWDSITIPLLGGVPPDRAINLGYYNGKLDEMFLNKSEIIAPKYGDIADIKRYRVQNTAQDVKQIPANSSWISLVRDLEYFINQVSPDVIVTPDPFTDSHLDHKMASMAVFEAVRNIGYTKGAFYFYANHHMASAVWPYGQKTAMINLPPKFNNENYASRIYSHPLGKRKQTDKIFALEANHDLRLDTEWQSNKGMIRTLLKHFYHWFFFPNKSYYRRAIRPNELFLVVPVIDLYQQTALKDVVDLFTLKACDGTRVSCMDIGIEL